MPKLKLIAEPTFKAKVLIPVAGSDPAPVVFTFKHRTKSDLADYMKKTAENPAEAEETDFVMETVTGWDLDDEFNQDNMRKLLDSYHGAGAAIMASYVLTLGEGRLGN